MSPRDRAIALRRPNDNRLRVLADALPQMVWVSRASDGVTTYANERFRTFIGDIADTCADHIAAHHPDDQKRAAEGWAEAVRFGRPFEIEARLRASEETFRWHKIVIVPVRRKGEVVEWLGTALDVEEIVATRIALQASQERLSHALDAGSDGLVDCNLVTGEAWVSDRYWRMLGYEPGDLEPSATTWKSLLHPEEQSHVLEVLYAHYGQQSKLFECEHRLCRKDGSWGWFLTRGRVVARDAEGKPLRYVGTHIDIDERKVAELQLAHMARHDALTGLPNRTLFYERLGQALSRSLQTGIDVAVLACDLDGFKSINDTLGHPVGDALLRIIGERMRAVLRPNDTIARLGGDEFAIIVGYLDEPHSTAYLAQRLIATVSQPIALDGRWVEVGLSIGYAEARAADVDADVLFKRADIALYEAKSAGRNTFCEFEAQAGTRAAVRGQLALDMKDGIRRGDFRLLYQPVIDVASRQVVSFEALLRWTHPTYGEISPRIFIALAEETGLITQLGAYVLREACQEAVKWPAGIRVAVNVSVVQLRHGCIERDVLEALAFSRLLPGRLKLEVTESVLMHDAEASFARLKRIKDMGVRIVLDDFGTGYSSLSYLRRFPFDKIKLDRSFIADIENEDTAAIVRAVVGIGHRLGMGIVAEGVETEKQLQAITAEGCGEVQGFLFSKPMTPNAVIKFLGIPQANVVN